MPTSPTPYGVYAYPLVVLRIEGKAADDIIERMVNFRYEDHFKKADVCSWEISDPNGDLIDDPRFEPDTEWEFRFGYPGDISDKVTHRVKYYEPVYADDGKITITLTTMGIVTEMM